MTVAHIILPAVFTHDRLGGCASCSSGPNTEWRRPAADTPLQTSLPSFCPGLPGCATTLSCTHRAHRPRLKRLAPPGHVLHSSVTMELCTDQALQSKCSPMAGPSSVFAFQPAPARLPFAVQLRLTPELKGLLQQAQAEGAHTSLRFRHEPYRDVSKHRSHAGLRAPSHAVCVTQRRGGICMPSLPRPQSFTPRLCSTCPSASNPPPLTPLRANMHVYCVRAGWTKRTYRSFSRWGDKSSSLLRPHMLDVWRCFSCRPLLAATRAPP